MPCGSLVSGWRSGIPELTRGVGKIANAAGPNLKVGERFVRKVSRVKNKFSFKINAKRSEQIVCRTVSCGVQRSLSQTVNRRTERVKGRAASQVRRKALRPRQFLRMCVRHSVPDSPDPDRAWYLNEMYSVLTVFLSKLWARDFFCKVLSCLVNSCGHLRI